MRRDLTTTGRRDETTDDIASETRHRAGAERGGGERMVDNAISASTKSSSDSAARSRRTSLGEGSSVRT